MSINNLRSNMPYGHYNHGNSDDEGVENLNKSNSLNLYDLDLEINEQQEQETVHERTSGASCYSCTCVELPL